MMGHKEKLKDGYEYDVISKWRKILCYCQRPGVTSSIKNRMNKRNRYEAKLKLKETYNGQEIKES